MTCDQCGQEIRIGDYPFCGPNGHQRGVTAIVRDEIPGGQYFENGFATPTRFDSHSSHRKALAARGYEHRVKNAGPDDKICPRWDTVDLEAAAVLVTRGVQARAERRADQDDRWPKADVPITITEGRTFRRTDLA